ncbi:hypothetical protein OG563_33655 [Nocardia vinacea]|uniref:Uncharacterized protein n=1 Tax=Nocardia vinacea TaxID=96468 RepID=A0ABZ1YLP7_9NOCA|nr:hypothetical protein [Nocardia vinacea]
MRLASVSGRATLLAVTDGHDDIRGLDVQRASGGRFSPDPARTSPRFLAPREVVVSRIDVIGEIRQVCRARSRDG